MMTEWELTEKILRVGNLHVSYGAVIQDLRRKRADKKALKFLQKKADDVEKLHAKLERKFMREFRPIERQSVRAVEGFAFPSIESSDVVEAVSRRHA
jgi:hypothetical protein